MSLDVSQGGVYPILATVKTHGQPSYHDVLYFYPKANMLVFENSLFEVQLVRPDSAYDNQLLPRVARFYSTPCSPCGTFHCEIIERAYIRNSMISFQMRVFDLDNLKSTIILAVKNRWARSKINLKKDVNMFQRSFITTRDLLTPKVLRLQRWLKSLLRKNDPGISSAGISI